MPARNGLPVLLSAAEGRLQARLIVRIPDSLDNDPSAQLLDREVMAHLPVLALVAAIGKQA